MSVKSLHPISTKVLANANRNYFVQTHRGKLEAWLFTHVVVRLKLSSGEAFNALGLLDVRVNKLFSGTALNALGLWNGEFK